MRPKQIKYILCWHMLFQFVFPVLTRAQRKDIDKHLKIRCHLLHPLYPRQDFLSILACIRGKRTLRIDRGGRSIVIGTVFSACNGDDEYNLCYRDPLMTDDDLARISPYGYVPWDV